MGSQKVGHDWVTLPYLYLKYLLSDKKIFLSHVFLSGYSPFFFLIAVLKGLRRESTLRVHTHRHTHTHFSLFSIFIQCNLSSFLQLPWLHFQRGPQRFPCHQCLAAICVTDSFFLPETSSVSFPESGATSLVTVAQSPLKLFLYSHHCPVWCPEH